VNASPTKTARGRPLDLAKRRAILDAANALFLSSGYAPTSMDSIARVAGVSKLTAYKHFGSKATLFAAVIERKCRTMMDAIAVELDEGVTARDALIDAGRRFLALVLSDDAIGAHRVIVEERERAPELGPLFYASAVQNASRRLAALVAELHRRGDVVVADADQAARDILALWRGQPVMHIELGVELFTPAQIDAHVARVVDLLLKAWR
jgi:TetR/AcrR family transcriptional repressor of mexJK operon